MQMFLLAYLPLSLPLSHALYDTCPSRWALARVPRIEADTGGIVETRIGKAVVNHELGGRHTAAHVAGCYHVVRRHVARSDVGGPRMLGSDSAGTQEAGGAASLRLEVAARTWKTRRQASAGHVTLWTHLYAPIGARTM